MAAVGFILGRLQERSTLDGLLIAGTILVGRQVAPEIIDSVAQYLALLAGGLLAAVKEKK